MLLECQVLHSVALWDILYDTYIRRRGLKRLENVQTPNNHMKKTYYLMFTMNLVDLTKIITKSCIGTIFFINLIRAKSFIVWLH